VPAVHEADVRLVDQRARVEQRVAAAGAQTRARQSAKVGICRGVERVGGVAIPALREMDQLREIGSGLLSVIWAVHNDLVSRPIDPLHTALELSLGTLTAPSPVAGQPRLCPLTEDPYGDRYRCVWHLPGPRLV